MTTPTHINRPHYRSFSFERTVSEPSLEQINKLSRNFIASLDLGCPNVKHVRFVAPRPETLAPGAVFNPLIDTHLLDEHQRYLLWVRQWKEIYAALSTLIRSLKARRRSSRPIPPLSERDQAQLARLCDTSNQTGRTILNQLSFRNLPRLQETAQALMNARWNGKLASREARRLRLGPIPMLKVPHMSDEELVKLVPGHIVLESVKTLTEWKSDLEPSPEELRKAGIPA